MPKAKAPTPGNDVGAVSEVPRETVIRPLVRDQAMPHPMEVMEKDGTLPILISIGYARISESRNGFVHYVIKSQGTKVISVDVSGPTTRPEAEEQSKIDFSTQFIDPEFDSHVLGTGLEVLP